MTVRRRYPNEVNPVASARTGQPALGSDVLQVVSTVPGPAPRRAALARAVAGPGAGHPTRVDG